MRERTGFGKYLLAATALAALAVTPAVGSAASLASSPFGIRATQVDDPKITALKGLPKVQKSAIPEPTATPATGDTKTTLVINTGLSGCTASSFSLKIPTSSSLTPSVNLPLSASVNWGDGASIDKLQTGTNAHSYEPSRIYNLEIDGKLGGLTNPDSNANNCIQSISHFGQDSGIVTLEGLFQNARNVQSVAAPPTTLQNASSMFSGASNFNGDISGWKTPNLLSMANMFSSASKFNSSLAGWDVSKVQSFSNTFGGASVFNQDLSSWNTGSATDMNFMFYFTPNFNGNISTWNTSKVKDMGSMFLFSSKFKGDLSKWDVSQVTNFSGMFNSVSGFNSNISNWNVGSAVRMGSMFAGASAFNQDLSSWKTPNAKEMNSMFYGASSFSSDLSAWTVANVTDRTNFETNSKLTAAQLPKWS